MGWDGLLADARYGATRAAAWRAWPDDRATSNAHDLAEALANSDLLFDRATLEQAIARMAGRSATTTPANVPVFLTVMHGGLLFAGRLALEVGALGLDLEFDYLHATRYRGAHIRWRTGLEASPGDAAAGPSRAAGRRHPRRRPHAGRDPRLVPGAGRGDVRIAVLAVKLHDRCVPGLAADYVGVEVPDRYVFGYGMDYHEQGRNLPAIYALKD